MSLNSDCSNGAYSEELVTGDSSYESSQSQGSKSSKKISKHILRKASDADFQYPCEWNDCQQITNSMNEFNHHVTQHLHSYRQYFNEHGHHGTAYGFECQWRGCNAVVDGQMDVISRHVFYHTFHQYLKFLGLHIQKVENLKVCALDTHSRNVIPELPEKLMCRWHDCGLVYDNPYIFYSHVAHHCEDFSKDSEDDFKCKWEGCDISKKRWYTMKEHLRSHTQAKIVACPTCGSLFANNTRYIDHLLRQGHVADQKFECSHCGNRFGSERILRDHMRHHVNHYKCPMCNMTCHSPSAVRDHVRYRHSDERIFSCDQCEYKAKTQTDLRRHKNIHVDKSQYSCQKGCQMVFENSEALLEHHKTHSDKKQDYECHICAKHFNRGAHLTLHLMEFHDYQWPSGHKRFRYKLHEDGIRRLQTIRYESIEVSKLIIGQELLAPQTNVKTSHPKQILSKPTHRVAETVVNSDLHRVAETVVNSDLSVQSSDLDSEGGSTADGTSAPCQGASNVSGGKKGAGSRRFKSLSRKSSNSIQQNQSSNSVQLNQSSNSIQQNQSSNSVQQNQLSNSVQQGQGSMAKRNASQKKTKAKTKSKKVKPAESQSANAENCEPRSKKRKISKKSSGPAGSQIVESVSELKDLSSPGSCQSSSGNLEDISNPSTAEHDPGEPSHSLANPNPHDPSRVDVANSPGTNSAHPSAPHLVSGHQETESWSVAVHHRSEHCRDETAEGTDRSGDVPPSDYTLVKSQPDNFWTVSVRDIIDQDKKFILCSNALYNTTEGSSGTLCKTEADPDDSPSISEMTNVDQQHWTAPVESWPVEDQKCPAGATWQTWSLSPFTSPTKMEPSRQFTVVPSDSTLATPVKTEEGLGTSASGNGEEDQKCFPWAAGLALKAGELYNLEMLGEVALSAQELARKEK